MSINSEYGIRENRMQWNARGHLAHWLRIIGARSRAAWTRYHQRARLRRDLAWLDERQLHDIGCTRAELEAEARRPFWR